MGKNIIELTLKLTLNKLEEIPDGYKQNLLQEEIEKINSILESENTFSREEDEEFKKRIGSKCKTKAL